MTQHRAAGARTLGRGLQVLRAVGARSQGATVAELCADTGLDRAVVHRLLGTLSDEGFVTRDEASRRFRLGVPLIELGGRAAGQLELYRAGQPALRLLTDGTRESSCLTVRDGLDAVVVDHCEAGGGSTRPPLSIGDRVPLHRLALGRAMLAFSPAAETLGHEEMAVVQRRGFEVGADDIQRGLVEVAAPIRDAGGEAIGALGVMAAGSRLAEPARLGPRVRTVAREVSRRLGWAE